MLEYKAIGPDQRLRTGYDREALRIQRRDQKRADRLAKANAETRNAIDRLCDTYGISPQILTASTRVAHVVEARHLLWWFLRVYCGYTVDVVAMMARRDKSTIVKCTQAITGRMDVEPSFRRHAQQLAAYMMTGYVSDETEGIEQMGHS